MGGKTGRIRDRLEARADELLAQGAPDPNAAGAAVLRRLLIPRGRDVYAPPSHPWPEAPEALVHDTRVASRRLVEALDLARPLLPQRGLERAQRDAKRLRRALGARREADVMLADLRAAAAEAGLPEDAIQALATHVSAAGAESFEAAKIYWSPTRLMKAADRLMALTEHPTGELSWRDLGAPHLYDRCLAPQARLHSLHDPEQGDTHHALRVDFKRLRYATEILAEVFPDEIDGPARVEELKALQDALGVLQDTHDLIRFLGRDEIRAGLEHGIHRRLEGHALGQQRARFNAAADRVLTIAPVTLGHLRRAAGRIGQLETRTQV